ncbi:uncharacterized protein TRIADDRAFT_32552 [Trichoplax adhaerens]|uniref:Sidoreflexin n=1 Tax=Trichoplax adhaerens TaxID=10228 RepID=B3SAY8_TRIAD|nr:hypothetical protein TRIADDRAFT_32552 [Trichoplax adhaerens]EDV20015.1 hypothetical protein TRIADDRAFT_32552 [Trichoplax adhaerens]|eukprot:XP_002117399.1 hypothetical protein TRIADDRAFT_32552 [Trichoplax adhaerens]
MDKTAYPPFTLGKSRFDQSTFLGRLRHFLDVTDPRTLFVSEKQLQDSIKLLNEYKIGKLPDGVTNEQLWKAQKIKQAIIHPDTNEKIFMPFRMSGFVPFGTPIVVGLLLPNPSMKSIIFWQWLNQSHNACVNYANRNASKPTPTSEFVAGYFAAITSAITIALGLTAVIKRADRFSPATRNAIQRFVPFPAVASASVCNVLFMRRNELSRGIEVVDKDGNTVGTSKIAAKKALVEMACTRAFLPAPILLLPTIAMQLMEKTRFLKANPRFHLPLNAIFCTISFGLALPLAISLFPQMSSVRIAFPTCISIGP